MRVVIEFSGGGRWAGTLRPEAPPRPEAPFDGRLELLRLLEVLVEDGPHEQRDH